MDSNNNNGMVMPVAPMGYGGYGFPFGGMGGFGGFDMLGGGGGWWIILLFLVLGRGFGGFGGGYGMGGGAPIIINNTDDDNHNGGYNNVQRGFDQAAVMGGINGIQNAVTTGFGNVQTSLCSGFAGVNATVNGAQNAIVQQLNTNEIASLNRSFAEQTANTAGFTATNAGIADVKYTIANEACNTRAANTANTQAILDKLCQLELDGYKNQLENKNDTIAQLRSQLQFSNLQASQIDQTAQIRAGQTAAVNSLVNELRSCPIPAQPVYGSQPIFTCPNNNSGCGGCGCGGFTN